MSNEENDGMEPMPVPANPDNGTPMQTEAYPNAADPMMADAGNYRALYPEIYYRLKPYVLMACDLMGTYGAEMPTQPQLEHVADGIYDHFRSDNPDMADYMDTAVSASADPPGDPRFRGRYQDRYADGYRGGFRSGYGGYFRRRGLGRDFIGALLLAELLGRGFYYGY